MNMAKIIITPEGGTPKKECTRQAMQAGGKQPERIDLIIGPRFNVGSLTPQAPLKRSNRMLGISLVVNLLFLLAMVYLLGVELMK